MSSSISRFLFRFFAFGLFAVLILAHPALRAEDDDNGENADNADQAAQKGGPSINDKTRLVFAKIKPLLDAKNYDAVLSLLYGLEGTVKPDSYDMSVIYDTEAKILWQGKNTPEKAIEPWEKLLALVEKHREYLDAADRVNHFLYLAQTYYLVASEPKNKEASFKHEYFDRALAYQKKWLQETPHPRQEDLLFYTSLLYQKAVENPGKVDKEMMETAKAEALKGLLADAHPKEQFYMLLVAIAQQESDFKTASDYLELLVTKHPTQKDYWMQLVPIYSNLAASDKLNNDQQRRYYARAVNAVERAQALGFLKAPKDNFNLISMYDQVGQFGRAIDLLYTGMKTGKVESTLKNWQVLAYFYEQISQQPQAIKVLVEAEQHEGFDEGGGLDRQIADLYYQLDNTQEVYHYCTRAVEHGNQIKSPYTTYQLLAYAAYQLRKYPEALAACEKALSYRDAPAKELLRLKEGIEDAIKQVAAEKAAAESERRSL